MSENVCTTDVRIDVAKFTWIINHFSFHVKKAKKLRSPNFSSDTNEHLEWFMELGFNELVADEKDAISLFVGLNRRSKKAFARSYLSVYGDKGRRIKSRHHEVQEYNTKRPKWGWPNFFRYDQNLKNFLTQDKLTIVCEIEFSEMEKVSDTFEHRKAKIPKIKTLSEDLESLIENQELVDVHLSVNNKDYPAHKSILAARSPVFAAMFRHKTKENAENRVIIEDIGEEVMDKMLRYIYTGKCENIDKIAYELMEAADKYALDGLKIICSEALCETLTVENSSNFLVLADLRGVKNLKDKAIAYISCNFSEVLHTETWKNMLLTYPELVNEVCKSVAIANQLNVNEITSPFST